MIGKFLRGVANIGKSVAGGVTNFLGKVKSAKDYVKGKMDEYAEKVPGIGMIYEAVSNVPTPFGSIGHLASKASSFIDTAHAKASKFHSALDAMSRSSGRPMVELGSRMVAPDRTPSVAPERQLAMDNLRQE